MEEYIILLFKKSCKNEVVQTNTYKKKCLFQNRMVSSHKCENEPPRETAVLCTHRHIHIKNFTFFVSCKTRRKHRR